MAKIPVTGCPAGLALDAAVTEVLGWTRLDAMPTGLVMWETPEGAVKSWTFTLAFGKWRPSEDIAAAWELAEVGNISLVRVRRKGWIALSDSDFLDERELWEMNDGSISGYFERRLSSVVIAPAPLAITRAFLLAHGVTEVEVPDD